MIVMFIMFDITFRTLDFSEVLPDKLYLSGVFPVNEENLREMGISCVVRGERERHEKVAGGAVLT